MDVIVFCILRKSGICPRAAATSVCLHGASHTMSYRSYSVHHKLQ